MKTRPIPLIPLVLLGILCLPAAAADPNDVFDRYLDFGSMVQGAELTPGWLPDGSRFWYTDGGSNDRVIWLADPSAGTVEPLFDVDRLRQAVSKALGYEPAGSGVPFDQVSFGPGGQSVSFSLDNRQWSLDLDDYSLDGVPGPSPAAAAAAARMTPGTFKRRVWFGGIVDVADTLSPDGRWFARLKDNDIVLRSTADGRQRALTTNGSEGNAWDIESMRMRLSSGIALSFVPFSSWSPDSLKLWAARVDRRKVPPKYEVNFLNTIDEVVERPFSIAGGTLSHTVPYVIDILTGEATALELGETRNFYFVMLGWRPDSSEVLFGRWSRDFKTVDVMAADAATGKVRTLFTESAETFVHIQHDVISFGNAGFTLLPDGEHFLWESTRDGWNHLYVYDLEGRLVRQLTSGEWPVLDVVSVDPDDGWVYFYAHGETPRVYDTHLYRVPIDGGRVQRLTDGEGQHVAKLSPSFKYFVDTWSNPSSPPRVDLRSTDGKLIRTLRTADISALEETGWTPSEEFTVKAADGETDLWGVMHKPYDFDPGKRYPVLEWLYAGPQIVAVDRTFGGPGSNQHRAMAQLGYIVVEVDARGTPERSKAFQDVIYRAWGRNEVPDHAGMIRQLGERHAFMDLSRVGIWGHSWGGYYAFRALADAPDVYHAAVSSAPGYDPWAGLLYEPYLDLPDRAREAYDHASPFHLAPKIRGKLMIAVGTSDYATFPEAMTMSRALIDAGIQHEQVVMPQEGHGYAPVANRYFTEAMAHFFERHLQP